MRLRFSSRCLARRASSACARSGFHALLLGRGAPLVLFGLLARCPPPPSSRVGFGLAALRFGLAALGLGHFSWPRPLPRPCGASRVAVAMSGSAGLASTRGAGAVPARAGAGAGRWPVPAGAAAGLGRCVGPRCGRSAARRPTVRRSPRRACGCASPRRGQRQHQRRRAPAAPAPRPAPLPPGGRGSRRRGPGRCGHRGLMPHGLSSAPA